MRPPVTVVTDPVATVRQLEAEESELGIWLAGGASWPPSHDARAGLGPVTL